MLSAQDWTGVKPNMLELSYNFSPNISTAFELIHPIQAWEKKITGLCCCLIPFHLVPILNSNSVKLTLTFLGPSACEISSDAAKVFSWYSGYRSANQV